MANSALNQIALRPVFLLVGFLVFWTFICSGVFYTLHVSVVEKISKENSRQELSEVTQTYSEILQEYAGNGDQIENLLQKLRTTKSNVREAILVNKFAGIISPTDKTFEIVNDDPLETVLAGNSDFEVVETSVEHSTYAVLKSNDNTIQGALIIRFAPNQHSIVRGETVYMLLVIVLGIVSAMLGYFIFVILMRPWKQLGGAMEDALVDLESHDDVECHQGYELLKQHHHIYRRFIARLKHRAR